MAQHVHQIAQACAMAQTHASSAAESHIVAALRRTAPLLAPRHPPLADFLAYVAVVVVVVVVVVVAMMLWFSSFNAFR
jgi:hypothetical protein